MSSRLSFESSTDADSDSTNPVVGSPSVGRMSSASSASTSSSSSRRLSEQLDVGTETLSQDLTGLIHDTVGNSLPSVRLDCMKYSSYLSQRDVDTYPNQFQFPESYKLRSPNPDERACDLNGQHCVVLDSLKAGLRYPLHPFYLGILNHYHLHPSQLTPNSWRSIAGFFIRLQQLGRNPSLPLFLCCHTLRKQGREEGWYMVANRPEFRLFEGKPDSIKDWKKRFFFMDSPLDIESGMRWRNHLSIGPLNQKPSLSFEEFEIRDTLLTLSPVNVKGLVTEENLARFGLSGRTLGIFCLFVLDLVKF